MALLLAQPHRFPLRALALQPGDAVVFHCLTLHRSGPNASGTRRYALNITYNARDNLPVSLEGAAGPMPALPYAVVEEDAAVAAGGTAFDPAGWGVPPISRAIHEALEQWADGQTEGLPAGKVVDGYETEWDAAPDDVDAEDRKKRKELHFKSDDEEAASFKCRALKLRFRADVCTVDVFPPGDGGLPKRIEERARAIKHRVMLEEDITNF